MSLLVARMHTNYPEYHGTGYYNFIIEQDEDALEAKIEEYSHDFHLEGIKEFDFDSVDDLLSEYPTKQDLNKEF